MQSKAIKEISEKVHVDLKCKPKNVKIIMGNPRSMRSKLLRFTLYTVDAIEFVTAQIDATSGMESGKLTITLRKHAHAIYRDFLCFKN